MLHVLDGFFNRLKWNQAYSKLGVSTIQKDTIQLRTSIFLKIPWFTLIHIFNNRYRLAVTKRLTTKGPKYRPENIMTASGCNAEQIHYAVASRHQTTKKQKRIPAHTRRRAFTHPSSSGLLVIWAYFAHTTFPVCVTKPRSATFTSMIVPFVRTPSVEYR